MVRSGVAIMAAASVWTGGASAARADDPTWMGEVPIDVAVPVVKDDNATSPWIGAALAFGLVWDRLDLPAMLLLRGTAMGAVQERASVRRRFNQGSEAIGLIAVDVVGRLLTPRAILRGYVEGSFGVTYLYTGIDGQASGEDEASVTVVSDEITAGFGAAAGLMLRLASKDDDVYLQAHVAYQGLAEVETAQNPGTGRLQMGLGVVGFFDL